MKLYIIRHGETEWNKEKKMQGSCDIPLNDYGRELARITGDALANMHWDYIYSSPLCRAVETASIIKGNRNIDIVCDDRLTEMCFGEDEGISTYDLRPDFSNFFFAPDQYIPSKSAETFEHILERSKLFLDEVILPHAKEDISILIVAHGALNKALMNVLLNVPIKDFWKGEFQTNCCLNEFHISENHIELVQEAVVFYEGATTNYLEK